MYTNIKTHLKNSSKLVSKHFSDKNADSISANIRQKMSEPDGLIHSKEMKLLKDQVQREKSINIDVSDIPRKSRKTHDSSEMDD